MTTPPGEPEQGRNEPLKTTPPFRAGDSVSYHGIAGTLEEAENPFGTSGRERCRVRDRFGIGYWHDPVTDVMYASPRFTEESLLAIYDNPNVFRVACAPPRKSEKRKNG